MVPIGVNMISATFFTSYAGGRFFVDVFGRTAKELRNACGMEVSLNDCLRAIKEQREKGRTTT